MESKQERLRNKREIRRQTPTGAADLTPAYGLSSDILSTAVRRLGFLSLAIAALVPAGYWVEYYVPRQSGRVDQDLLPLLAECGFIPVAGLAIFALARIRNLRPELILDFGLIFQVLVALGLSLTENTPVWGPEELIRGASWNCLWISLYVITIPGPLGKTALAAVASACMAPLGLLITKAIHPADQIHAPQILNQLLPFAAVGWSIPVARNFYHLRAQVSRARAMGSYELLELIGKGGMGEVWTARHRTLTRVSAIKLIRPEALTGVGAENPRILLHRFEREARATAALRSPHTVALYDYGTTDEGSFFYAMEFLDGVDLETLVQRFGPLPAGRAVWLLSQAARSLAEAHNLGLVHRDIKPRNLFTCRLGTEFDFVKVLDFGLVKVRELETTLTCLTREGVTTGTPAYMAPEVAMGRQDIDGRADIYSLGCVAYWLVTGQLVFESDNPMAVVLAHIQTPPEPPSRRTEIEVPEPLEQLILQCLEKDPARRPQDARQLIELLAACEGIEPWTHVRAEQWWCTHLPEKPPQGAARPAEAGGLTM